MRSVLLDGERPTGVSPAGATVAQPPREEEPRAPGEAPAAPSARRTSLEGVTLTREPEASASLSYSSLSELERCGYRYYLERVLGIGEDRAAGRPGGADPGLEARARGTLVHSLLETLDFRAPHGLTGEDVAARGREQDLHVGAQEGVELAGLIERALRTPTAQRIAAAIGLRREHPFAFALAREEPLIIGVIDLLAQEADGGSLVIDYKSDRVTAEDDLASLVERDYGVQRLIYALAVLRTGAARVEIVHWFLERPSEPVAIAYAAGELPALEKRLASRVEGARAGGFAVSARPHRALCLTCPGRGGLCSWSETETLREGPDPATAGAGELPGEG
jgi:ATP-dependent exoDNAse (exonuclease V) beta subunit